MMMVFPYLISIFAIIDYKITNKNRIFYPRELKFLSILFFFITKKRTTKTTKKNNMIINYNNTDGINI